MKVTITLPDQLSVRVRGSDPILTETSSIPADILARAVEYGWQQANADAAASAASVALPAGLEGEARKAWLADEANGPAILATRQQMIRDSIARKVNGEWHAARAAGGGESVTAEEAETYRLVTSASFRKTAGAQFPSLLEAFASFEKGMPTAERRAIILNAVEDLDDPRKAWIAARVAELLSAKEIDAPDFTV